MTTVQTKTCTVCNNAFAVSESDARFLASLELPAPKDCPKCRERHRLSFRDERRLYHRKCDATGDDIISAYSADKPYKVYLGSYWWSDSWDPLDYGREYDFSRLFFEQFAELSLAVPKLQYSEYSNENCPYMNRCSNCRNVYMSFNMDRAEDCLYCEVGFKNINSMDCSFSKETELCVYCVDSVGCYSSTNLVRCSRLSDSHFCYDCHSGDNLILCWNLRNKNYCILNQQLSREDFIKQKAALGLESRSQRKALAERLSSLMEREAVHKYANILKAENCDGDNIFESKNCHDCYDVMRGEDLTRVISVDNNAKSSMDSSFIWDGAELVYESMSASRYQILFSYNVWESNHVSYSELCHACDEVFGCSGLKKKSFCVLNKQYTESNYRELVARIRRQMIDSGEWGRFFPPSIAPFCYNESLAQEYYPLTKAKARELGYDWKEKDPKEYQPGSATAPETFAELDESILNETLGCSDCGKNYRIVKAELALYQKLSLPAPAECPDCRYLKRLNIRNPRTLFERKCDGCRVPLRTTFSPSRREIVLCEDCYLGHVL